MSQAPHPLNYAGPTEKKPLSGLWAELIECQVLLGVLAVMIVIFSYTAKNFFTPITFRTIANDLGPNIALAAGMTFVIMLGAIDLSVGSIWALSTILVGTAVQDWQAPFWAASLLGLGVGLTCGLINGIITVWWRIPSFIVTLGMLELARGAAFAVTQSQKNVGPVAETIGATTLLGLSSPFWVAIAIVAVGQVVLTLTVFGRYVKAIGGNETTVQLSGVNPRPVKIAVFAASGLLAAVAGIMSSCRQATVTPNDGERTELAAIAAVVIGGTSLLGGRGSVVRSLLGVVLIAVLGAGLVQISAREWAKHVIPGALIVLAVGLDYYRQRLRGVRIRAT